MLRQETDLIKWKLLPEEEDMARTLNPQQRAMLQTMNVELAENISEFLFSGNGDSGTLLNTPDYWMLKGRRTLVLELLDFHRQVTGELLNPESNDSTQTGD